MAGASRTQYLELPDTGAHTLLGSRPTWLWGFEHGVNEHGVAIGNEKVWTVDDPAAAEPALIGMDLVRLALERAATADDALDVLTSTLAIHGQGGIADVEHGEAYWSSFLVADALGGWVLETSGQTWASRPVEDGAAISNRLTLGTDWTRASPDVPPGADFDRWARPGDLHRPRRRPAGRDPGVRGNGRVRGNARRGRRDPAPPRRATVGGTRRRRARLVRPTRRPTRLGHGDRVHARARLHDDERVDGDPAPCRCRRPVRAWVAVGSPCTSVFVPVFPPGDLPGELADASTWTRFSKLRDRVERDGDALAEVRAVLGPVESDLWEEADLVASAGGGFDRFTRDAWTRVNGALAALGV